MFAGAGSTSQLATLVAVLASALPAAGLAAQTIGRDSVPGTLVSFELVLVPAGAVTVDLAGTPKRVDVSAFWIGRTEVTWDLYDVFALGLDSGATPPGADAVARPTRPYGAPAYGFGHQGYPAISIARQGAEAFCAWLSARTGKRYRLPTEAEWQRAADLARGDHPLASDRRDALAWHAGNASGTTHLVATKAPDALGLFDLFGNAAEWVMTGDGPRVTRGGSFRDGADRVGPDARATQDYTWNERDPQYPKSRWWLSDAPFVGFRVVREP